VRYEFGQTQLLVHKHISFARLRRRSTDNVHLSEARYIGFKINIAIYSLYLYSIAFNTLGREMVTVKYVI